MLLKVMETFEFKEQPLSPVCPLIQWPPAKCIDGYFTIAKTRQLFIILTCTSCKPDSIKLPVSRGLQFSARCTVSVFHSETGNPVLVWSNTITSLQSMSRPSLVWILRMGPIYRTKEYKSGMSQYNGGRRKINMDTVHIFTFNNA